MINVDICCSLFLRIFKCHLPRSARIFFCSLFTILNDNLIEFLRSNRFLSRSRPLSLSYHSRAQLNFFLAICCLLFFSHKLFCCCHFGFLFYFILCRYVLFYVVAVLIKTCAAPCIDFIYRYIIMFVFYQQSILN